jgi:hypothetical protein
MYGDRVPGITRRCGLKTDGPTHHRRCVRISLWLCAAMGIGPSSRAPAACSAEQGRPTDLPGSVSPSCRPSIGNRRSQTSRSRADCIAARTRTSTSSTPGSSPKLATISIGSRTCVTMAWLRIRHEGGLRRTPPASFAAMVTVGRRHQAPVDVSFRDWASRRFGETACRAAEGMVGPAPVDGSAFWAP